MEGGGGGGGGGERSFIKISQEARPGGGRSMGIPINDVSGGGGGGRGGRGGERLDLLPKMHEAMAN
jgi:hypothetical protein